MAESSLVWNYLKPKLRLGFAERIESPSTGGFPDLLLHVKGHTAFIELKYLERAADRLGTRLDQRNWHRKAQRHGLRTFLLVRISKMFYLIPGSRIQEPFDGMRDVEARSVFKTMVGDFDVKGLYAALFPREAFVADISLNGSGGAGGWEIDLGVLNFGEVDEEAALRGLGSD